MSENSEEIYTRKHIILNRLATAASIFAWMSLVLYLITIVGQILTTINEINYGVYPGIMEENPLLLFRAVINMIRSLFTGLIYWIVLKGISLALRMIVEIDINYRLMAQDLADGEQSAQANL